MSRFLLFLSGVFLGISASAQVYNTSNFVVNPNENVYVQGDFINQSGGRLTLQGTIHLKGNWENNDASSGIVNNNTGGLLRLVGSVQQTMGGTTASRFNNIEINNAAGVSLLRDQEVRQVFTFTSGKVFTNANYLIISSNALASIVGYDVNKYVVGNLRRYMTGTSAYDLPIGTSAYYELATLKFNAVTGMNYVNASFVQSVQSVPVVWDDPAAIYVFPDVMNPIANPLLQYLSKWSHIVEFLNYGYWAIAPDNFTSGNFKLTLTERGHSNGGNVAGQHALIRRANGSSPWGAEGIYPFNSQSGTGSNPITVYMDQMTTFQHFIIGKSKDGFGPLAITLLDFNALCYGSRVKLTWTTSNEENNDHFTIEKSRDTKDWQTVLTKPGQLFSSGNISYTAYDDHPWDGLTYYRLSQTDIDGTTKVYEEQWLRYTDCHYESEADITITQETGGRIIIHCQSGSEGPYTARIIDPLGRVMVEEKGQVTKGSNTLLLQGPSFRQGISILNFRSPGINYSRKLIIP